MYNVEEGSRELKVVLYDWNLTQEYDFIGQVSPTHPAPPLEPHSGLVTSTDVYHMTIHVPHDHIPYLVVLHMTDHHALLSSPILY